MMNKIIGAISASLFNEFGENYNYESESIKQGLRGHCFLITSIKPSEFPYPSRRYRRLNPFCIQYFPSGNDVDGELTETDDQPVYKGLNQECSDVGERMMECLEIIKTDSATLRGVDLSYQIVDDVLNFFVGYNCFIRKDDEPEDPMEDIGTGIDVKDGE